MRVFVSATLVTVAVMGLLMAMTGMAGLSSATTPCSGAGCSVVQSNGMPVHWTDGALTVSNNINVNASSQLIISNVSVTSSAGGDFILNARNSSLTHNCGMFTSKLNDSNVSVVLITNGTVISNMGLQIAESHCDDSVFSGGVFVMNSTVPASWIAYAHTLDANMNASGNASVLSHVVLLYGFGALHDQTYQIGGPSQAEKLTNGTYFHYPTMYTLSKELNVTYNGYRAVVIPNPMNTTLNWNPWKTPSQASVNVTILGPDQYRIDITHHYGSNITMYFPVVVGKEYHFTAVNDSSGAVLSSQWRMANTTTAVITYNTTLWGNDPTFTMATNSTATGGLGILTSTNFEGLPLWIWLTIVVVVIIGVSVSTLVYYRKIGKHRK